MGRGDRLGRFGGRSGVVLVLVHLISLGDIKEAALDRYLNMESEVQNRSLDLIDIFGSHQNKVLFKCTGINKIIWEYRGRRAKIKS